ncbi:MAG: diaminopimelate decarboxylase [Actinobacteria bacterium]|nr:diaminopimelate decarboxylase [Actinomycetota bacterium]
MSADAGILEVVDGRPLVDGTDILDLAQRIPTPFFLYSARRLRWNVESIRNAFTRRHIDTDVLYASKACSMMWLLRHVLASGIDVEVNSGGELWKALKAGFRPDQIVFNGAAKAVPEVREALRVGLRALIVDSLFELERVAAVAAELRRPAVVALRVDIDVPTQTHPGMATTRGGKFGVDLAQAVDGYRFAAAHEWLEPRGLHVHLGSQITTTDPYVRGIEAALDLVAEVEAACDITLEFLDTGGGFPVPFKPAEEAVVDPGDYFRAPFAVDEYAAAICGVLERRRPDLRLLIEPGRFIAASAAVLVTRVENEKVKYVRDPRGGLLGEERWITVDAGYNTLLEHCLYDWYYPSVVAGRLGEGTPAPFRVAGPLCDAGDVFVGDDEAGCRSLPSGTGVGDVVVFSQVGAYGLEMMTPCNCRPRAAVYAVEDGVVRRVRREETCADMIAHDEGWEPRRSG